MDSASDWTAPFPAPDWVSPCGNAILYNRDCLSVLPEIPSKCELAFVSDPPWGSNTKCNAQRFSRKSQPWWDCQDNSKVTPHKDLHGDKQEFDPRPLIARPCVLWGANWFTRHLEHSGGWLVWDKRKGAEDLAEKGWPLGEAELAWTNIRGSVRVFRNLWSGLLHSEEKGQFYHPTQKPVALMRWCIRFVKQPVIADPYMGSGSTGVAAMQEGRKFVGCEVESKYFEIACERIAEEHERFALFNSVSETQTELFSE